MRIAIASDDGRHISSHTGRCKGFVIFDIADGQAKRQEHRANTFTDHAKSACAPTESDGSHLSGESHHSHDSLLGAIEDCEALVTQGMGPRLVADLAAKGIKAFVCREEDVDEAADQYAADQLARVEGGGGCCHR